MLLPFRILGKFTLHCGCCSVSCTNAYTLKWLYTVVEYVVQIYFVQYYQRGLFLFSEDEKMVFHGKDMPQGKIWRGGRNDTIGLDLIRETYPLVTLLVFYYYNCNYINYINYIRTRYRQVTICTIVSTIIHEVYFFNLWLYARSEVFVNGEI